MRTTRANWKVQKQRVHVTNKSMPDVQLEAQQDGDVLMMQRRHAAERAAYESEARRVELVALADKPEGTEARKVLRQMQTFRTKPQSIPSNNYSSSVSQRAAKKSDYRVSGERSCRPSSRTDSKINSYFSAKSRTPKF